MAVLASTKEEVAAIIANAAAPFNFSQSSFTPAPDGTINFSSLSLMEESSVDMKVQYERLKQIYTTLRADEQAFYQACGCSDLNSFVNKVKSILSDSNLASLKKDGAVMSFLRSKYDMLQRSKKDTQSIEQSTVSEEDLANTLQMWMNNYLTSNPGNEYIENYMIDNFAAILNDSMKDVIISNKGVTFEGSRRSKHDTNTIYINLGAIFKNKKNKLYFDKNLTKVTIEGTDADLLKVFSSADTKSVLAYIQNQLNVPMANTRGGKPHITDFTVDEWRDIVKNAILSEGGLTSEQRSVYLAHFDEITPAFQAVGNVLGHLGELRFGLLCDALFVDKNMAWQFAGNLYIPGTSDEIPVDIYIRSAFNTYGIQVKQYDVSGATVTIGKTMTAGGFISQRLQSFSKPQVLYDFFGAYAYNQPTEYADAEYRSIYGGFESTFKNIMAPGFNIFMADIMRIVMDVNFDGQVTSYKNNFFTMGDMLVPGSMLIEGMLLGMGKAQYASSEFKMGKPERGVVYPEETTQTYNNLCNAVKITYKLRFQTRQFFADASAHALQYGISF